MGFCSVWDLSDNNLKEFLSFMKNDREHYNCQWACHGNVIRNADCYGTLKRGKQKTFKIILLMIIQAVT